MRVHFRVIEGQRSPDPGLRGHRHQAPGRRRARDVHGPQAVVRGRRRAHVPAALAEDREDRGDGDRRRQPRQAVLLARESGKEGARPRETAAVRRRSPARFGALFSHARFGGTRLAILAAAAVQPSTSARRVRSPSRARFVAGSGRGRSWQPRRAARWSPAVLLDYECLRGRRLSAARAPERLEAGWARGPRGGLPRCAAHGATSRERLSLPARSTGLACTSRTSEPWRAAMPLGEADVRLVDGFRLGPAAPEHRAVVDGDEKSAAIAAASVVAKVVRDRRCDALDALYPAFGFASHVGYITPAHSAIVRERGLPAIAPAPQVVRGNSATRSRPRSP